MLNIEKINVKFIGVGRFIGRFRVALIVLFMLITACCVAGLKYVRSDTSQDNYFLEGDRLVQVREYFESVFGNDDFCAVLVKSPDVFDPSVLALIREMGSELKREVPYADDIQSLTDLEYVEGTGDSIEISSLVPDVIPSSRAEIEAIRAKAMDKPAIRNRLVSEDSTQTWIMLRLKQLPKGKLGPNGEGLDVLIGSKVKEIVSREKYASLFPLETGLPVINVDKRDYVGRETPKLLGFSLLLTGAMLAFFLRSVSGVVFPLASAVSGLLIVFGIQGFMGIVLDPSMIFLPVFLGLAMAISYSVYLINAFKDEFEKTGDRLESMVRAVGETAWPIGFSALTTAAALMSFCFVPLKPIRWMGLTAAALTVTVYVLTLFLLPALISFKSRRFGKDNSGNRCARAAQKRGPGILDRSMEWLGRNVPAHGTAWLSICAVAFCIGAAGMLKVDVSFDMRESMGMHVPYVKRVCEIADSKVGSLYSYGIGIELPEKGMAKDPETLRRLDAFCSEISGFTLTKKVSSLLDIVKDMNRTLNAGRMEEYRIADTRNEIAQQLLLYENAGGAEAERWVDYEYRRLRIMVEVGDYNSGEIARELYYLQKKGKELFPGANILLTGSISQFSVMQDYVSWGQIQSLAISLVVISILMMLVFGSVKIGLIAMIPNVCPAVFTGAVMGIFGFPLDILTVTVMPMLLGLSVDDTIHFITHAKLEFERTGRYSESIVRTFRMSGKAMCLTTIILSMCFAAYLVSNIIMFKHLGILVIVGAVTALLADYFVTPVLLKLLRVFGPEHAPSRS